MNNQCDGCARGLPIDESGLHKGIGWDVIACTKHLYAEDEMNNQQIEQYRKILADKPEGVTHYTECVNDKAPTKQEFNMSHLLSDIKTIVDQYDENQLLKARVDELESLVLASRCPCCDGYINNTQGICRSLADIREIESLRKKLATAKADAVNETYRAIPANLITADAPSWFCDRIDKLRRGE